MEAKLKIASRRPSSAASLARLLLAPLVLLLSTACATAPRGASEASWAEYLDTLSRYESNRPTLVSGSPAEAEAIERFQALMADLKAPDLRSRVHQVYAEDVFFNDTLKTARGVDEVEEHLAATAEALESGTVEFLDLVAEDGDYYFRWELKARFKRLAKGEEKSSVGMTHVRFDEQGKVVVHQDFWDSTGGLFEHVPALGWGLRRAKGRL